MFRVLVIEGDLSSRTAICSHLSGLGMEAEGIGSSEALDRVLAEKPPGVVVCALDLPEENGITVAARLRVATRAGIVMMTPGERREERIMGWAVGVDHDLPKPVDLQELGMVVRNLHSRLHPASALPVSTVPSVVPAMPPTSANLAVADCVWRFDAARWTLSLPERPPVRLSMAEKIVLEQLLGRAGQVASRDKLVELLSRQHIRVYSRNLDALISRLRRKAERVCGGKLSILSARNIGYVFTGRCEFSAVANGAEVHAVAAVAA